MLSEIETPLVGLQDAVQALNRGSMDAVQLTELPGVPLLNLRVNPADPGLLAAMREAIAMDLPVAPNTVIQADDRVAMWLAPDEWLLRCPGADPADLLERIRQSMGDCWFAASDQTSGYSILRLQGPAARDVLNAGCPLDLHPRTLTVGQCAQSHFFKTSILLRPLSADGNTWEVIVRRSFADYTARMLLDAMQA